METKISNAKPVFSNKFDVGRSIPTSKNVRQQCALCTSNSLLSNDEFITHLQDAHCKKDGDLYICRYGPTENCVMSSVVGMTYEQYIRHIFIHHLHKTSAAEMIKTNVTKTNNCSDDTSLESRFTVNHFTQNLSSVLSDTRRSRAETTAFFTRHWGEQFLPCTQIVPSANLPRITADHFRHYLATTAKKHRNYLKVRKALRSSIASQGPAHALADLQEIPMIFFADDFSLRNARTFESIFMEPSSGEVDVFETKHTRSTRSESSASLTSMISLKNNPPIETESGRYFRPCKMLHSRLEYYHDTLGILLNCQLEEKSEEFWRSVNSYSVLHGELEAALRDADLMRLKMRQTNEEIYAKSEKLLRMHWARENRKQLLHKLEGIACLRDAQITVQMLLNQNNFPKALECIETAREVLNSDLKGVNCFRHLSSQLDEMQDAIAKMLHEEFIVLVQREFVRFIEHESDVGYQESHIQPVILGLIRCYDFRFLQVLQTEITEAAKNTVRRIILARFVECDLQLAEFDPSLGNLGEKITYMRFDQWLSTLDAVFNGLYLFCCCVMSLQQLILENVTLVESLNISNRRFPNVRQLNSRKNDVADKENLLSDSSHTAANANIENYTTVENNASAASMLAVGCSDFVQLRNVAPCLFQYAISCAEDCAGKIIVPPRNSSKDSYLDKCSPETFCRICEKANQFLTKCQLIPRKFSTSALNQNDQEFFSTSSVANSSLQATLQKEATNFIAHFHEERREKLKEILDAERWQPTEFPVIFQQLIDNFMKSRALRNIKTPEVEALSIEDKSQNEKSAANYIMLNNEKFIVVGTAVLLIQTLAEYCSALECFSQKVSELNMHVVEILKQYNSRACQLILGAGALRIVGLKTITVRNLALSCRSLQLITHFIPAIRCEFEKHLPDGRKNFLRHFDHISKDYNDHIEEIEKRLVTLMDNHIIGALTEWKVEDKAPTPCFQLIVKQIGKFFSGYSAVMPLENSLAMLLNIHDNFKLYLKQHLQAKGVTPHDSLTYGLASQDFAYYVENMRAFPGCQNFPNDSLNDVLQHNWGQRKPQ